MLQMQTTENYAQQSLFIYLLFGFGLLVGYQEMQALAGTETGGKDGGGQGRRQGGLGTGRVVDREGCGQGRLGTGRVGDKEGWGQTGRVGDREGRGQGRLGAGKVRGRDGWDIVTIMKLPYIRSPVWARCLCEGLHRCCL